jgi:hypothetical protein
MRGRRLTVKPWSRPDDPQRNRADYRVTLGKAASKEGRDRSWAPVAISDERDCERRAEAVVYVLRLVTPGRKTRGHGPTQRITGSST